jgi:hypothetical protein
MHLSAAAISAMPLSDAGALGKLAPVLRVLSLPARPDTTLNLVGRSDTTLTLPARPDTTLTLGASP